MSRALVCLILVCTACGIDSSHGLTFVTALPLSPINAPVNDLNHALGCQAVTVVAGDCASGLNCIREVASFGEGAPSDRIGECDFNPNEIDIVLEEGLNSDVASHALLHELGHAFGLSHTTGIMAAQLDDNAIDTDYYSDLHTLADHIKAAGFSCGGLPSW